MNGSSDQNRPFWYPPDQAEVLAYLDGCPDDWLEPKQSARWHTIALVIVSKLGQFEARVSALGRQLSQGHWRQWKHKGNAEYRDEVTSLIARSWNYGIAAVNAISFTEAALREYRDELFKSLGIGFEERVDDKGTRWLTHEYITFESAEVEEGYHLLDRKENQMLPLMLMSWFVLSQFLWLAPIVKLSTGKHLKLRVISDKLSGDLPEKREAERLLYKLFRYHEGIEIELEAPDKEPLGVVIADNFVGLLNSCVTGAQPGWRDRLISSDFVSDRIRWGELAIRDGKICTVPILPRLQNT